MMDVRIALMNGGITMDVAVLKGLSRGSHLIAHLSDEDKDLIMIAKDERFPKTVAKSKDTESALNNRVDISE